MKKLKLSILFLTFFVVSAYSKNDETLLEGAPKGFPVGGEGVKVIPLSQMSLPESMKKMELLKLQQQKTKGYVETDSSYPSMLLSLGRGASPETDEKSERKSLTKIDETGVNPFDTSLKKHLSQIRLTFPFSGIPFVEQKDVIAYSAMGKWQDGWTGIVEIFNYKEVGTCSFNLHNKTLEGGNAVQIMKEAVRYDVNKKPTTILVEGNKKGPFIYRIVWSDNINFHVLECANEKLDPQIVENSIKLAQKIDSSLSGNDKGTPKSN